MDGTRVTNTYDAASQLLGEERSGASAYTTTFTYDAVGNRLKQRTDGDLTLSSFDVANRLTLERTLTTRTTYAYDADGNQRSVEAPSGDITTQSWSYENRLVQVEEPLDVVTTYTYALVKRDDTEQRVTKDDGMAAVRFVWDEDRVVAELDELGSPEAEYTQEPAAFGNLISQKRAAESNFYHYDALGSTRELTDTAEVISDNYIYKPFGSIAAQTGATTNPYQWVGQQGYYRDSETSLYLMGQRPYRPSTGRFPTKDSIRDQEENLYKYVGNDPVNATDPSGLAPQRTGGDQSCPTKPGPVRAPKPPAPYTTTIKIDTFKLSISNVRSVGYKTLVVPDLPEDAAAVYAALIIQAFVYETAAESAQYTIDRLRKKKVIKKFSYGDWFCTFFGSDPNKAGSKETFTAQDEADLAAAEKARKLFQDKYRETETLFKTYGFDKYIVEGHAHGTFNRSFSTGSGSGLGVGLRLLGFEFRKINHGITPLTPLTDLIQIVFIWGPVFKLGGLAVRGIFRIAVRRAVVPLFRTVFKLAKLGFAGGKRLIVQSVKATTELLLKNFGAAGTRGLEWMRLFFLRRFALRTDLMFRNALQPFKGGRGGFTNVGRALTKHPNVVGAKSAQELIQVFGNNAGINKAAAKALKNIMRNGKCTIKTTKAFGKVVEFKLANGLGARFDAITYEFNTFLGRGL